MRKRRPAKLMLVCLLLGAIINVLVAWGLVIWVNGDYEERSPRDVSNESISIWRDFSPAGWPDEPMVEFVHHDVRGIDVLTLLVSGTADAGSAAGGSGPATYELEATVAGDFTSHTRTQVWFLSLSRFRTGWPLRTFESLGIFDGRPERDQVLFSTRPILIRLGPFDLGTHRLPYGPLWPGLIVNTVFYAAIVWLLIRGPWETRRRWRELHGKCGACGYPRGESPVCTECGGDLSNTWGRAKTS